MKSEDRLGNTKYWLLATAILVLVSAGIAGTYLFDDEVSSGNKIKIACFDLKVDGGDTPPALVDISGILPGESFLTTIPLRIVGDREGKVSVTFDNFKLIESNDTEPELTAKTGTNTAELWEGFYVSVNGGSRSTLKDGLTKSIGILKPNETTYVVLKFDAKTSITNDYQGDSFTFDIILKAEQQ
ncbi:MAG: hypothetical protein N2440_05065 [Actinobacteria bacterium]|nr:hypothetical protein [Actinomycetota bacterium]